ncbi:MAG: hypothetical protein ACYC6B_01170 [Thermoleophilia bacterium]
MAAKSQPLAVIHYFYLLKEDREDLQKLWQGLAAGVGGRPQPAPSMDLGETGLGSPDSCRIIDQLEGEDLDLRLLMMSDLSVVQVCYREPAADDLSESWRGGLERLRADRESITADGITVFGETTLLVSITAAGGFAARAAAVVSAATLLQSDLKPAMGGDPAVLVNLLDHDDRERDFYALATADPDTIITTLFPQTDALIKKLGRTTAWFEQQRRTIVDERAGVDRDVGSLLHRQVVVGAQSAPDTLRLEQQIDALSRMFGVLATDSQLVRQSAESLERDISLLEQSFIPLLGEGQDEIGGHYMEAFGRELAAARDEARNLDFSRINAQAAIEVVRTQVELLRAREEVAIQEQTRELLTRSVLLQKERLSLQVAAGFIEFVLVFYYLLKSWEGIVGMEPVEHISPLLRLIVIGSLSASTSVGTHFLAQTFSSHSWRSRGLWISIAFIVASFAAMVVLSIANI